jgi:hypothetical protein
MIYEQLYEYISCNKHLLFKLLHSQNEWWYLGDAVTEVETGDSTQNFSSKM